MTPEQIEKKLKQIQTTIRCLRCDIQNLDSGIFDAIVNFDTADPNTGGTVFTPAQPQDGTVLYVSDVDASEWTWNGAAYVTYVAPYWAKGGNLGTNPANHFVGTRDNVDLAFRVNNAEKARLITTGQLKLNSYGSGTFTGTPVNALAATATGTIIEVPIASGTYTPTLTDRGNTSARTAQIASYMRIGSVVTVSGVVSITPTVGASTYTSIGISLPVSTTFFTCYEGAGTGSVFQDTTKLTAGIQADCGHGSRMAFSFYAPDTAAHVFMYHFTYRIT